MVVERVLHWKTWALESPLSSCRGLVHDLSVLSYSKEDRLSGLKNHIGYLGTFLCSQGNKGI